MAETTGSYRVIAQGAGVTMANRPGPRHIQIPADRPGVVIFLHGVNDPGVSYEHVERGLCEGLNERLSRRDLRSAEYGAEFRQAQNVTYRDPRFDRFKEVKYDPDTYQFKRTESGKKDQETHSMLIPFYWGYRASPDEIKGGEKHPVTLRGQYQDIHGNRLSKNFAKGGGMFNNATTNIPEMYGAGFQQSTGNRMAALFGMSDYQYSSASPRRRYQVLAAVRLAMLIREIRRVDPNETITVMAHSQGSVITLLAQAMLAESKEERARCADCIIMVDSPYSLGEPFLAQVAQPSAVQYSTRGKLNTLLEIVKAVTTSPHAAPGLDELKAENPAYGGRTGKGWSPARATRIDSKDASTHVFAERDNRGKVYLYFCTEDATVALPNIKGIGTYGVPSTIDEHWNSNALGGGQTTATLKAMDVLKEHRFYQRLWSKGGNMADGKPCAIGKAPPCIERVAKGATGKSEDRVINAESIVPAYVPNLYGDEAIKGTAKKAGKDRPDQVLRDTLLGNPNASVQTVVVHDVPADIALKGTDAVAAWFNGQSPDPEDHTAWVRQISGRGMSLLEREETPNETRARLENDRAKWDENSYHSAILRDTDNVRRVAAMDVAIGQARCLDDPDMRDLLVCIADWKIDEDAMSAITNNPCYARRLSQSSRNLVEACFNYYANGVFPSAHVPTEPPHMIDKETVIDRMVRR